VKPLLTPTQTVGPFFHDCLLRSDVPRDADAVPAIAAAVIHMRGFIYDGDGVGVPDAMLEWWHADRHAVFSGFGRVGTALDGRTRSPLFGRAAFSITGTCCRHHTFLS